MNLTKRRKTNLLQILNDGRAGYLEFLRNLTPQAVIFSLVLIVGSKLDFTTLDFSNTPQTAVFGTLLFMWGYSAWSNSTIFMEKILITPLPMKRASRLIKIKANRNHKLFCMNIMYAWRKQRILFLEMVILVVIVEFGLIMGCASAIYSAQSIMGNF